MEVPDRVNLLSDSPGAAVCSKKLQFCHYMKAAGAEPQRRQVAVARPDCDQKRQVTPMRKLLFVNS